MSCAAPARSSSSLCSWAREGLSGIGDEAADVLPHEVFEPQRVDGGAAAPDGRRVETPRAGDGAGVPEAVAVLRLAGDAAVVPGALLALDEAPKQVGPHGAAAAEAFVVGQAGGGEPEILGDYEGHFALYLARGRTYDVGSAIRPASDEAADRRGAPGRARTAR